MRSIFHPLALFLWVKNTHCQRIKSLTLKKYDLIVAGNGTSWNITSVSDRKWNDNDLNQLKQVPGSAFEVIANGAIRKEC
ncbi:MAG TPA: hypothetical protein DCE56_07635 [Cyanobacteria bacterium UBA8553]|nr:hypothetical protein [Cyanobacteria bacterium UBA8553]HAJ62177.1 hypothetical protein [Cyanobacteria bacterium UBA8543]